VSFVAWHRPLRDRPRRYLLVSVGTIFRTDSFALVQNVAEMQNQVAEMEIEVEVWKAMAHQGQQPPTAPLAAPAAPDELQGASGLSEDSVGGPPPASPDTSAGSVVGY
jgi:hypothetical protein